MQITTAAFLTTLVAAPMAVMADSCDKDTSCKYWDEVAWTNAAEKFCDPADNRVVKTGDSFVAKTSKNDDGAGGAQIFSGSYEVTGQKDYTIHDQECSSYMSQIFAKCGGYGGSIDTGFGTVTASCAKDTSAEKPTDEVAGDDEDQNSMPAASLPALNGGDRRKRNNAAIRAKRLQDSQAKAELKQHKEDEATKQKQEEEAKIHEEHQKVAEDEDGKAAQGAVSRRDAEDEDADDSVTTQTNADAKEDRTSEEDKIHAEHAKVAAEEDQKAAENKKVADADAAKMNDADADAVSINSRDDSMAESKLDEEDKIHDAHAKVAADEDNKILENLKLAQQTAKFIKIFRRDDLDNAAKMDADQKHEDDSKASADAKTQEDKTAEDAKILAEHDKVAADEKTKEDQKAAGLKKQADDKAAEDAKIKSQTASA